MKKKIAAGLSSVLIAIAALTSVGTAPASADPAGEQHRCWDPYSGWVNVPSTYRECMHTTLDIFSTSTWARKLTLDGTCAAMLARNGHSAASVRSKCQDWPSNNYPGGDYWEVYV